MTNAVEFDQIEVSSETALDDAILEALQSIKISSPDPDVMPILRLAARLTPEDNSLPISTSRLFYAAVVTGLLAPANGGVTVPTLAVDLPPQLYAAQPGSFAETVARAINGDTSLVGNFYDKLVPLFQLKPIGGESAWPPVVAFSPNTARILGDAAVERRLSGDAILRSIFSHDQGLLYNRMPMKRVAEAAEKPDPVDPTGPRQTLQEEVDAALAVAISFPILDHLRARLYQAAKNRKPGNAVEIDDIAQSLVLTQENFSHGRQSADASKLLFDALASLDGLAKTPLPDGDVDPDPKNPVRFTEKAVSLLRRGHEVQRRIFRNRALGAKGVVAAILTTLEGEKGDDLFGETSMVRARFLEIIGERFAGQPAMVEKWTRALALEPGPTPRLTNDNPSSGKRLDHLDIAKDASAIANVACGQNGSLPMAFGIFGDWGAGKTFFMRLIQEQIVALVVPEPPDDGFEHAIVQIQFNAWHYAETNLWASLVGHIFSELDRWMTRGSGATPKQADELLSRLSTSRQLALEAATELMQRRKNHDKAGQMLASAENALLAAQDAASQAPVVIWGAAVRAVREAITGDEALGNQLASVRLALGVPELLEDKAKLAGLLNELNETASAGNAALGALRATVANRGTMVLAVVALVLVPAGLFAAKQLLAAIPGMAGLKNIGQGFESLGGVLAMASVLVSGFGKHIRAITDKFTALRGRIDDEIRKATEIEQRAVAGAGKSLGDAAAEVEKARSVLRATGDQVAAALRDYAEDSAGPRIARFVRARAGDEGYGRHMGLVSAIRRDFEQLESLMLSKDKPPEHLEAARLYYERRVDALIDEAGTGETLLTEVEKQELRKTAETLRDPAMPPEMVFRRIVLYIDDLDRCDEDKVVEVLQAVNMLLTFRLFVVIVAVDARWLTRSLEKRYPDFFGAKSGSMAGRATAADYLEKIFQIPYWVPKMTRAASQNLVGDLIAGDQIAEAAPLVTPEPAPTPGTLPQPLGPVPSPKPAVAMPEDEQPEDQSAEDQSLKMTALGLTRDEMEALRALSPYLGGSPRRAGRFVNLYRVAKATLSPTALRELEETGYRALATQLAIATGAPNMFGSWVTACAADDAKLERIPDEMKCPSASKDEGSNLRGALNWFQVENKSSDALADLRSQALRASRFSFVLPAQDG